MGTFRVTAEISRPSELDAFVPVGELIVDTGSEMTWTHRDLLTTAGVSVRKKDQHFVIANGTQRTRQVGYAVIRSGEFETIDEVVFAEPGGFQLLGARTLEGFNATIDVARKRLVVAGPMPVAFVS